MSEYIDKEDALKEAKAWSMYYKDDLVSRIENLPSREIVRCKDCKYAQYYDNVGGYYCWAAGDGLDRWVKGDDYCSYGERKDQEEYPEVQIERGREVDVDDE